MSGGVLPYLNSLHVLKVPFMSIPSLGLSEQAERNSSQHFMEAGVFSSMTIKPANELADICPYVCYGGNG
ncbi:hypothetical protein QS257_01170 [Terrilactibacillus sp. S3-3]|nr:hypothetical protein QS257_01170 [Terrilactibacillus sp. S3-3]